MRCPRCRGWVEEKLVLTEDASCEARQCVNCGWYGFGAVRSGYTAERPDLGVSGRWAGHEKVCRKSS